MSVQTKLSARSRARIDAAEAEQSATAASKAEAEREAQAFSLSQVSAEALRAIDKAAQAEARRIPAALRVVAAPSDIATDTLLAMSETDNGRRALHRLSVEALGTAERLAAEAHCRMTAKRTVSDMLRRETIAPSTVEALRRSAITTAEALDAAHVARTVEAPSAPLNGRGTVEAALVQLALDADGPAERRDADHQRALGISTAAAHGFAAGKLTAWNASGAERDTAKEQASGAKAERLAVKAERRTLRSIAEQGNYRDNYSAATAVKEWSLVDGKVVGRQIRVLRGPDLATLLDQRLRVHADRTEQAPSGRTFAVHVSDKQAGATFREALRSALSVEALRGVKCRGIASLRGAVEALTALDADGATERARYFMAEAHAERSKAEALREAAPAYRRGLSQAERAERDAASSAERSAERAEVHAAMAQSLAALRRGTEAPYTRAEAPRSMAQYVRLYGRPLSDVADHYRHAAAVAYLLGDTRGGAKALGLAATADRIDAERSKAAPYVRGVRAEAAHVDNGRPLDLLDVLEAALAGAVDNGRSNRKRGATGAARKRAERAEALDASSIDTAAALAYLAPSSIDTAARALSTVLDAAREAALDACIAAPIREARHDKREAAQAEHVEAALVRLAYGRRVMAERRTVEARRKREAEREAQAWRLLRVTTCHACGYTAPLSDRRCGACDTAPADYVAPSSGAPTYAEAHAVMAALALPYGGAEALALAAPSRRLGTREAALEAHAKARRKREAHTAAQAEAEARRAAVKHAEAEARREYLRKRSGAERRKQAKARKAQAS